MSASSGGLLGNSCFDLECSRHECTATCLWKAQWHSADLDCVALQEECKHKHSARRTVSYRCQPISLKLSDLRSPLICMLSPFPRSAGHVNLNLLLPPPGSTLTSVPLRRSGLPFLSTWFITPVERPGSVSNIVYTRLWLKQQETKWNKK